MWTPSHHRIAPVWGCSVWVLRLHSGFGPFEAGGHVCGNPFRPLWTEGVGGPHPETWTVTVTTGGPGRRVHVPLLEPSVLGLGSGVVGSGTGVGVWGRRW